MRSWLPLLLLSLFVYDVAAEAFEAECLESAQETCCACVCQTHTTNLEETSSIAAPANHSSSHLQGGALFTAHISDKSLFHPPKTLA